MTKFVTREIEIPEDPDDDDSTQFGAIPSNWSTEPPTMMGTRRTPSAHSGQSGGSGRGKGNGGGGEAPPLPVLPDALLDALAREPPTSSSNRTSPQPPPPTQTMGRSSFTLNRASAFFDSDASTRNLNSLPSIPPQSPLAVSYPESLASSARSRQLSSTVPPPSEGFSIGRTSAPSSPALSRSSSRALESSGGHESSLPSNPTPPLDNSTSSNAGGGGGGSRRSMFRSLAFGSGSARGEQGKSRTSSGSGPPPSSTPSSPQIQRQTLSSSQPVSSIPPRNDSISTMNPPPSSSTRFAPISSVVDNQSDSSRLINARLLPPGPPPPSESQSPEYQQQTLPTRTSSHAAIPSPALSKRPSRQQLATGTGGYNVSTTAGGGGGGGGSGSGFRFSQRMSHSAREADRWLFEAQAAGLGIGSSGGGGVEASGNTTDHAADNADSRRASIESKGDDDEEDDGGVDAVGGWARRGEQYTRDLGKARAKDDDLGQETDDAEGASISVDDEGDSILGDGEGEEETKDAGQTTEDDLRRVREASSPERPFHDALQSVDAGRTPTFPPTTPPFDTTRSPNRPNFSPASPTETIAAGEVPLPPSRRVPNFDLAASSSSQHPPSDASTHHLRRDGKLSLPIYSDAPLEASFEGIVRRRNRSDGDGLDEVEQAELARRLQGIDVERNSTATGNRFIDPQPPSPGSLADFVVAVVGPRNVGKSSVVKKGLKPRSSETPTVIQEDEMGNRVTTTTTSFTIGGMRRTIEVLEIDMHLLRYNEEGVIWPDGLPQCEGAMLCYDSTDPDALSTLAVLLKAFWTRGSDVPLIVLACKAVPMDQGKNVTDPIDAVKICNIYGAGIVTLDGGIEDPNRKTKESFKYIIRQIMENRGETTRPASSAASHSPTEARRGSYQQYATTSRSPFTGQASPAPSPSFSVGLHLHEGSSGSRQLPRGEALGLGLPVVQETPLGTTDHYEISSGSLPPPVPTVVPDEPLSPRSQAPTYMSDAPTYETEEQADLEDQFSQRMPAAEGPTGDLPPVDLYDRRGTTKNAALDLFFSRDDMIDKFLYAAVTGNDEAYVTLFLITYRRFSRPYDVLEKLIERFEFVAKKLKSDPLLSRFAQMKICGVLSIWMQNYPGDFTAPSTYCLLSPFLQSLLPSGATWVAHYALELIPLLSPISSQLDPDLSWALPDKPLDLDNSPTLVGGSSPSIFKRMSQEYVSKRMSQEYNSKRISQEYESTNARRPSIAPSYDSTNSQNLSVPGSNPHTNENSPVPSSSRSPRPTSEAGTLETEESSDLPQSSSTGSIPALKYRGAAALIEVSNMVMEMREEEVALQITRLAWEMFGGMTPRDLLRHVLAPRDPANPRVALRDADTNVMRSIAFVNYLANWTATLILVQGKIKQRARIMEKMLLIALALREQENFDSLMGVLAGINSQPIFRLTETMELVTNKLDDDPKSQPHRAEYLEADKVRLPKKLRSLNRLMAATKSFSAYRLALANSGMNMIPYLGVHLQDITVVNEIKSDLRDGKVNWSKFSQMGRSAAIVLDCARIAPTLPVEKIVERAIINVQVLDEERQYALSYQHQPRQSDKPTGARSRLRTLAKSTFATSSS